MLISTVKVYTSLNREIEETFISDVISAKCHRGIKPRYKDYDHIFPGPNLEAPKFKWRSPLNRGVPKKSFHRSGFIEIFLIIVNVSAPL